MEENEILSSTKMYKMIDDFKKMFERFENTPNNKFRKVAEKELKEIYKNIINVQLDKSNNVYGMFDKTIDEEIWNIIYQEMKFWNWRSMWDVINVKKNLKIKFWNWQNMW